MKRLSLLSIGILSALVSACAGGSSSTNNSGGGGSATTSSPEGGATSSETTSSGGAGGATTTSSDSGGATTTSTSSTTDTSTGTDFMIDPAHCKDYLCEGNLPAFEWAATCGYETIVDQVLEIFPFCGGLWGDPCSMAAEWLGAPCQSTPMCTHLACESGAPLNPGCDAFEIGTFCDTHPTCCTVAWDEQCVTDWEAMWMGASTCTSTCQGPSPAGCLVGSEWACAPGYQCVPAADCKPSVCACDGLINGSWLCTPDCDGGECVPM